MTWVPFVDETGKTHDNFYVDPKTEIIYFKKGHNGKRIKFSTGFKRVDFVSAKRYANKEFDRRIGKTKGPKRSLIKDELDAWIAVKESEGLAQDTMNNVRRAALQIGWYWGLRFPSEITKEELPEWFSWWEEKHPEITMENVVKYMRNFCRYLAEKSDENGINLLGVVPRIPLPNAKEIRVKRKRRKKRIIADEDLKVIYDAADSDRDRLVILFMYTMASRVTETLELRIGEEIFKVNGEWVYQWDEGTNKAGLDERHLIHEACIPLLETQIAKSRALGTNRLFPQKGDPLAALKSQQIDWEAWRERAKLPFHWTPHTFRHTCLSNLFNNPDNPQAVICKLYRVSLAVALESYVKTTDSGRKLMRNAVKVGKL